jgi:DNA modification methylase
MYVSQYNLPFDNTEYVDTGETNREKLIQILSEDLDFHDQDSSYASHNFHSFPAKFPPQLPRKFITGLTNLGDTVLDPMMGSSTTVLEAFLLGRWGIGFDIDPLALLISRVKVTHPNLDLVKRIGNYIIKQAKLLVREKCNELMQILENRWDARTREFIDYWFAPETQVELLALITEIEKIEDEQIKAFFKLVFSAIIITKTGGVSLAFDLAHTRPHRAKVVISKTGKILLGEELQKNPTPRTAFLTKTLRSAIIEFEKRFQQNLNSLRQSEIGDFPPEIKRGNAQNLPLDEASIDLIVTSPPYASNAIDYMRAHKFSLVWLGYMVDELTETRKEYIGGEITVRFEYEKLPDRPTAIISHISKLDEKKGRVLYRYYSEMTRTLSEMFRILKPDKSAIVVVGSSIMRGIDTETQNCLAEIGQTIGFEVPKIGVRNLDRNRRMLPASSNVNLESRIQQRMHEEYVIGFYKPKL